MLNNALEQFLNTNFDYLVYSTADILIPSNLFDEVILLLDNKSNKLIPEIISLCLIFISGKLSK